MPRAFKIYSALWHQALVTSLIVSSFYWILLHKGSDIDVNNVLVHMTNAVVLVIDLLIVRHPPKYSNFIYLLTASVSYMIFTIVYQFLGGLDK